MEKRTSQRKRRKNLAELIPVRTESDKPPPIDYFNVEAARFTVCVVAALVDTNASYVLPRLYHVTL